MAQDLPDAEAALAELSPGDILRLVEEPDNELDPRAVLLNTRNDTPVGWVPSYLLDMVHKFRDLDRTLEVIVVRANGPSVPWHLRLLCRLEAGAPPRA